MKLTAMIPALALAALAGGAVAADKAAPVDDNMIGLTTPNGKLVYDFINLWFNEHKGAEAFDKYVSHDNYMNHAVYNSSKNKHPSFEEEKAEEARIVPPQAKFEFKQAAGFRVHPPEAVGPGDVGSERRVLPPSGNLTRLVAPPRPVRARAGQGVIPVGIMRG